MSLRSKENINLRMIMTAIRRHDLYTLVLGSYNKQWYLEGRISNRNFMTSFERTERRAVINLFSELRRIKTLTLTIMKKSDRTTYVSRALVLRGITSSKKGEIR